MDPTDGWDEFSRFGSPQEMIRFELYLRDRVDDETLVEIPVGSRYSGSWMFNERWFTTVTGIIWRFVAPEPPFYGVFERVSKHEQEHPRLNSFGPYVPEPEKEQPGYTPMGRIFTGDPEHDARQPRYE